MPSMNIVTGICNKDILLKGPVWKQCRLDKIKGHIKGNMRPISSCFRILNWSLTQKICNEAEWIHLFFLSTHQHMLELDYLIYGYIETVTNLSHCNCKLKVSYSVVEKS